MNSYELLHFANSPNTHVAPKVLIVLFGTKLPKESCHIIQLLRTEVDERFWLSSVVDGSNRISA